MEINRKSDALSYQDEVFNELYNINTLIKVTVNFCQNMEFRGEYYGIPIEFIPMISNERNEYISMLTIISDKIAYINKLGLCIEESASLHKNTDYCSR